MAVTPQTNTDLGAIAEALRSRDDFIICGHVSRLRSTTMRWTPL